MPKKTIMVDYHECDPNSCENGVCQAALACPRRILGQEEPYEMPDITSNMCVGCSRCLPVCPRRALRML